MEEEILKNQDINDFLQKYDQNDWNIVISKLAKIGLLSLEKDKSQKDFYTFDDFDNIISILEKNIIPEDENSNNENIKSDNLNIDDLNNLKEPDDNEEIKDENINKENPNENSEKKIETLEDKIINKDNPINEKKTEIPNSSNQNSNYYPSNYNNNYNKNYNNDYNKNYNNNYNKNYNNYNNNFSSNYNPSGSYSNYNYRNNNNINSKAKSYKYTYDRNCDNYNNNYNIRKFNVRNNLPCLNYNYSTSSPQIKNDKETDPCCNKSRSFYNSYSFYGSQYC